MADLAEVTARFAVALRAAGLSTGPDRVARFTRAVTLVAPETVAQLRYCAHATLATTPADIAILDPVFDAIFAGSDSPDSPSSRTHRPTTRPTEVTASEAAGDDADPDSESPAAIYASAVERLRHKDFSTLTAEELDLLAAAMSSLRLSPPLRRSRRYRRSMTGPRLDLRTTLRMAQRFGGDPVKLVRRRHTLRPRRLVMLCDISGSMEPYARAMIQLLYCASTGTRAEVFSFATRLTRLTPALSQRSPARALAQAGRLAPDWSGGTKIGLAVKDFLDRFGRAGMARGAVVLIISDGWETGDPSVLGTQMARLSRVAHRIIWVNPRTQSPHYQPLVGGMAAAWPHCDAVVSAHSLDALGTLVAAIAAAP
ncbi:VWA domain-containing protein [Rhizocola hellebori]|uniref:VWA domain-containing protein n=1 Tax=Rhizocola hellebori TaxID=1392758 RepID=A0A8J3QJB9_9ACTN|nr:VWA domain-containing protein [Rhizocola hellebori]GIH11626.1 VWA domain-containing protein [Rhizocola hellebori]